MDDEKSFFKGPMVVVIASIALLAGTVWFGYNFILGGSGGALQAQVGGQWGEIVDESEFYTFNMKKVKDDESLAAFAAVNEETLDKVEKHLEKAAAMDEVDKYPALKASLIDFLTAYNAYLMKVDIIIKNPGISSVPQELSELKMLGDDAGNKLTALENNFDILKALFDKELFTADKYLSKVISENKEPDIIE